MAVITWEQKSAVCGDDDNVTVTIWELADGVATGKEYSARLHKKHTEAEFKALLKEQILADRTKRTEADTVSGKIDLSDFETYLKQ